MASDKISKFMKTKNITYSKSLKELNGALMYLFLKSRASNEVLKQAEKGKPKTSSSDASTTLNGDLEQREMLLLSKCVASSAFPLFMESA